MRPLNADSSELGSLKNMVGLRTHEAQPLNGDERRDSRQRGTPPPAARAGERGARRHAHPALILLIIAGAQLMVVLDGTIVNIALPSMGRYFNRSQTDMTWALNAYSLAFGGLLLLGGRMGDILGRRRMFVVGLSAVHHSAASWPASRRTSACCSPGASSRASAARSPRRPRCR